MNKIFKLLGKQSKTKFPGNTVLRVRSHSSDIYHLTTVDENELGIRPDPNDNMKILEPKAFCGNKNWSLRSKDQYSHSEYTTNADYTDVCQDCKQKVDSL